ncbi:MAG: hypothetical protein K2H45_01240 [Acetatifactor sp.]|nr:hypothetical protein [Acetatifactor sp.]
MAKSRERGGNSNKNIMLYVAGGGALLMILVYFLVFQKLVDKAEEVEASNRVLAQRVEELKGYYDDRETNLSNTLLLEQLTDELLTVYPADAKEEDAIMLAVQMQRESGVQFLNINMERSDSPIHVVSAETVQAAASEKYTQEIQFRDMSATYVNEVSYTGLKNLIQMVYDSNNRIGIHNVTYSRGSEENPNLSGQVDLIFYSVRGTGKEYVAPDIMPYLAGTDNIFGEIAVPNGN